MPRTARRLYIAAVVLVALGAALLLDAKKVQRAYRQLDVVWTAADAPTPDRFRIAAFPAGVDGRGVPDRAILLTLADWNNPLGVVHWGDGDNKVAVQRRLLRIDLPPNAAAPFLDKLNDAIAADRSTDDRRADLDTGDRLDERRLTILRSDNLREAFDYRVTDTGEATPLRILAAGDKGALIIGGLWALMGVVFAWTAVLCAIIAAVLQSIARRKLV